MQFYEFETMETRPSIPVHEATPDVQRLVKEMLRHKARFDRVRSDRNSDDELSQFWLRKPTPTPYLIVAFPASQQQFT